MQRGDCKFIFIPFNITEIQTELGLSLSVLPSSRPSLLIQFFLPLPRVVYFSSDGPKKA